jgi:hypothetical protein
MRRSWLVPAVLITLIKRVSEGSPSAAMRCLRRPLATYGPALAVYGHHGFSVEVFEVRHGCQRTYLVRCA